MILAPLVADLHVALVALPAGLADAAVRLAGPVEAAVEVATLWNETEMFKMSPSLLPYLGSPMLLNQKRPNRPL